MAAFLAVNQATQSITPFDDGLRLCATCVQLCSDARQILDGNMRRLESQLQPILDALGDVAQSWGLDEAALTTLAMARPRGGKMDPFLLGVLAANRITGFPDCCPAHRAGRAASRGCGFED